MRTRGSCANLSVAVLALGLAAGCSSGSPATDRTPAGTGSASASTSHATTPSPTPSTTPTSGQVGWAPPTIVAPPAGASAVADSDQRASGVVRVQVNNCVGLNQGSGFFVGPDLVMTAASLFTDAASIAVHSSSGVVRGDLVGLDKAKGVALVRLPATRDGSRLTGTVFSTSTDVTEGTSVTMLAHPLGQRLHQDSGTVTGTGASAQVDGTTLGGLLEHDANASPGTSGGPLLTAGTKVVGMELATSPDGTGVHHAVPMSTAAPLLAKWKSSTAKLPLRKCTNDGPPSMTSIHPDAPAIKASLNRYLWGLGYPDQTDQAGTSGADIAWQKLGAQEKKRQGSKQDFFATYRAMRPTAANVDNLEVRDHFTDTLIWTVQFNGPGKKCVVRKEKVVMSSEPGHWVIDQVTDMGSPNAC